MKILILCSDPIMGELIISRLHKINFGFDIIDLEQFDEEKVKLSRYSLVIIDYALPTTTADRIIRAVNCINSSSRPAIYILSHIFNQETILLLYDYGIDEIMTVPLNMDRFVAKITGRIYEIEYESLA